MNIVLFGFIVSIHSNFCQILYLNVTPISPSRDARGSTDKFGLT
jgi:hypothetical protein